MCLKNLFGYFIQLQDILQFTKFGQQIAKAKMAYKSPGNREKPRTKARKNVWTKCFKIASKHGRLHFSISVGYLFTHAFVNPASLRILARSTIE